MQLGRVDDPYRAAVCAARKKRGADGEDTRETREPTDHGRTAAGWHRASSQRAAVVAVRNPIWPLAAMFASVTSRTCVQFKKALILVPRTTTLMLYQVLLLIVAL